MPENMRKRKEKLRENDKRIQAKEITTHMLIAVLKIKYDWKVSSRKNEK